ncbi:MAG: M23 family metallopeptidase [Luteolibacter sp.]
MHSNRSTLAFLITLALAAIVVWWVIRRVDQQATSAAGQVGWQHADAAESGSSQADPWLELPDAWTQAAAPVAREIGPASHDGIHAVAVADGIVVFAGFRDSMHAVILAHRGIDGEFFESVYAPLSSVAVRPGDLAGRGMILGRTGNRPMADVLRNPPAGVEKVPDGKSPLAIVLESPETEAWMTLEIGNAEKMLEFIDKAAADPD